MKASALRASLLSEAVSGRLVPQFAEEGTAADLLKEIEAEKKALISTGKLKKEKPLPEITEDEIPFEIPESWEWVRLGKILSIKSGDGLIQSSFAGGSIPVYGGNGVVGYHNKSNTGPLTLIIGRVGYYCGSVHITNSDSWVTDNAFIVTTHEKYISVHYLAFVLRWLKLSDKSHSTAQPVISGRILYPTIIPLPPLAEQRRIVAKLEELMPLVDAYEKEEQQLTALETAFPENMRKSILQEAVSGKLVPQIAEEGTAAELLKGIEAEKKALISTGKLKKEKPLPEITEDEIPFEIPESWEWVRLGDIFSHNNGKQLNASNTAGCMMTYITTSNLYWNRFVLDNLKEMPFEDDEIERCTAVKGDLLVCEGGDIGRAAIWNYDYPIRLQNHIHKLRAYRKLETLFFYYVLYYYKATNRIGGKGIGIQGLSSRVLHNIFLPLPPLAEQRRIVSKVEELMKLVDTL